MSKSDKKSNKKSNTEVPVVKTEATQFRKTMGRKTGAGKKGVVVMTPAASEIADAHRKNYNRKLKDCITKVFPDEE